MDATRTEERIANSSPRICSLLPSATEIVCALGLRDNLVAVTHECDYPAEVADLPKVTSSVMGDGPMTGAEIDRAIRRALENLSTIYLLDRDMLADLKPDLILTQELCEVCAVSFDRVQAAAARACPGAEILSLEPTSIEGVIESIVEVGSRAGVSDNASFLASALRGRLDAVQRRARSDGTQPRVLTLEWLDPPFTGGHWVPEMVEMAGGANVLGAPGERSTQFEWARVDYSAIDIAILMPCGFDLERTLAEYGRTHSLPDWLNRRTAGGPRIAAVDGSAYFNRPGPRIVDGVEILASLLHPAAGSLKQGSAVWLR